MGLPPGHSRETQLKLDLADSLSTGSALSPEQKAIRGKCFHRSGTFVEFPIEDIESSIPARFEKIVRIYPDRIAVKTRGEQLTYDELNKRANRLARVLLARRGSVPEPVALFLDRWDTLVVGHLAVLKAGKFSIALDPGADPDRTAHLLGDSCAQITIVEADTRQKADGLVSRECLVIDVNDPASNLSDENPGIEIRSEAYAYLRYTSGSTGRAKGAIKSHRHALKAARDFANNFHLCPDDRLTPVGLASIGKQVFGALLVGARFCPFDVRKEGLIQLGDWLRDEEITVYYSFPTALRHFLGGLSDAEVLPDIRLIELEGEPVYRSDVELIKKHVASSCIAVNALSSAETGTASLYFVDMKVAVNSERVPVGYTVDGVQIWIVDDADQPVEGGQIGEVVIQSGYLSSGYWRKPDVTNQRFTSPSDSDSRLMYRTGDLGLLSRDGCLHLLGRKDFQVKVRSFRVDVSEVESAFIAHDEIRGAAVIGRNDQNGNTKLVAYVVPRNQPGPALRGLKSFLRGKLPEFMIPAEFVFLDELPLLSTGKVNRHTLHELKSRQPDRTATIVAPRTPVEKRVAAIWAEVLALAEVGICDNFFDLGGDSLSASRVVSQVIRAFNLDLPLTALFDAPTVAEMAAVIAQGQQVDG